MTYNKGDRVKHPTREDWGLGEVLEDCRADHDHVRVFFVVAGDRTLSLAYVKPVKVEGEEASHIGLDNLSTASVAKKIKYQSLQECVRKFLTLFPQGFQGEDYISTEREYKVEAHEMARDILSKDALDSSLASSDHEGIAKAALRVSNNTNLIFPNERMSLRDGLKDPEGARIFAEALRHLLYGEEELKPRFMGFADVLEKINAAKWTTATYFLFIRYPEQHIFVKPLVTQQAAKTCAFEINYKPSLNWLSYQSVQKFALYLAGEISELHPRDMIDVQSFMWCISPDRN